jgi:hypothetical protein
MPKAASRSFAHCERHTFISLAHGDDGDGNPLRRMTHTPPKTCPGGYTLFS